MIEYAQYVRLVLAGIDGSMELHVTPGTDQSGVVAGADRIEAERDAAVQDG